MRTDAIILGRPGYLPSCKARSALLFNLVSEPVRAHQRA